MVPTQSPSLSLESRHALVCGASSGIGRATARTLASWGARITILARRENELRNLQKELEGANAASITLLVADLDQPEQMQERIDAWLHEHGPVHVLIHNTGGPPAGPLLQSDANELFVAFRRHVMSAHLLVRALVGGMQDAGYGRIINVLSTSVREPIDLLGVSNTIRAAMAAWAKSMSRELPAGVTINNVLPGFTATERLSTLARSTAERTGRSVADVEEMWKSSVPERRLGQPEEIAAAIAFLASPAASYIRGVSLAVDGGRLRSI